MTAPLATRRSRFRTPRSANSSPPDRIQPLRDRVASNVRYGPGKSGRSSCHGASPDVAPRPSASSGRHNGSASPWRPGRAPRADPGARGVCLALIERFPGCVWTPRLTQAFSSPGPCRQAVRRRRLRGHHTVTRIGHQRAALAAYKSAPKLYAVRYCYPLRGTGRGTCMWNTGPETMRDVVVRAC